MHKPIKAKKNLGQHFLIDLIIAEKITSLINPKIQNILEVGPGTGVLTQFIIKKKAKIKLIEIDPDCVNILKKKYRQNIILDDFLILNINNVFDKPFTLIGNFPYNISSPILSKIYENRDCIAEVIGMFQHEIAERVTCMQGKKRGILSVLIQAFYHVEYCFKVTSENFSPPPKVESGVIKLVRNQRKKLECNEDRFIKIIKSGFNQKRKLLRNALKKFTFEDNGDTRHLLLKRAEQLSVEDFIKLTNYVR